MLKQQLKMGGAKLLSSKYVDKKIVWLDMC